MKAIAEIIEQLEFAKCISPNNHYIVKAKKMLAILAELAPKVAEPHQNINLKGALILLRNREKRVEQLKAELALKVEPGEKRPQHLSSIERADILKLIDSQQADLDKKDELIFAYDAVRSPVIERTIIDLQAELAVAKQQYKDDTQSMTDMAETNAQLKSDFAAKDEIIERIMTQHWDMAACQCWVCKAGRKVGCRPREGYPTSPLGTKEFGRVIVEKGGAG